MASWLERVGVMHVHSRYSDGSGSVEDILAAAREAGVDHIVLSDHDSLAARREGWQGMHGGVAVIAAVEVTPRRRGHLVGVNVRQCLGFAAGASVEALDAVRAQGGYAIIAHPKGTRKIALGIRHVPWRDWEHPAVRGLEIWSYTHDWIEGVVWWRLPEAYEFWKFPQRRVRGPEPEVLRRWDELGRTRRLGGFGGLDCHATRVPLAQITIFPYAQMFRFLRNHLFVRREAYAADPLTALDDALQSGRGFVAHDILADSAGTQVEARLPDGNVLMPGDEAPFVPNSVMTLALPRSAEIRWIANGRCRLSAVSDRMAARPAGPGVYRFEARLDGAPWIFTNAFYFR